MCLDLTLVPTLQQSFPLCYHHRNSDNGKKQQLKPSVAAELMRLQKNLANSRGSPLLLNGGIVPGPSSTSAGVKNHCGHVFIVVALVEELAAVQSISGSGPNPQNALLELVPNLSRPQLMGGGFMRAAGRGQGNVQWGKKGEAIRTISYMEFLLNALRNSFIVTIFCWFLIQSGFIKISVTFQPHQSNVCHAIIIS